MARRQQRDGGQDGKSSAGAMGGHGINSGVVWGVHSSAT
jgi:hypothetical protein